MASFLHHFQLWDQFSEVFLNSPTLIRLCSNQLDWIESKSQQAIQRRVWSSQEINSEISNGFTRKQAINNLTTKYHIVEYERLYNIQADKLKAINWYDLKEYQLNQIFNGHQSSSTELLQDRYNQYVEKFMLN